MNASVNLKFVANHSHNRNPITRPIVRLQHLKTVNLAMLDLLDVNNTALDRLHAHLNHLLVFRRAFHGAHIAVI